MSCNHIMHEYKFSDRSIYATAWRSVHRYNSENRSLDSGIYPIKPFFGLYADFHWRPIGRNEFIDWPDFGIPKNTKLAFEQISNAFHLSKTMVVEIGCIGAHGRTGTMLACMNILDRNMDPYESIIHVKENYCKHAVETSGQAMFVETFWRMVNE